MSAHTPGPWRIEKSNDGEDWTRGAWDLVAGEGRHRVVLATRAPWPHRAAESDANARLIAAAPDLLAALKWALPFAEKYENTFPGGPRQQLMEAKLAEVRAAIAKAEGK